MQPVDPLSHLAHYPSHAPIAKVLPTTTFTAPGTAFPCEGQTVEEVLRNIEHARKELNRWEHSIAILSDEAGDLFVLCSFHLLLDCLAATVTDFNHAAYTSAVKAIFPGLMQWSGCVIRDAMEAMDLHLSIHRSLHALALAVVEMGAAAGVGEKQRRDVHSIVETAEACYSSSERANKLRTLVNERDMTAESSALA